MQKNHQKIASNIASLAHKILSHEAKKHGPADPAYYKSKLTFIGSIPVGLQRSIAQSEHFMLEKELAWHVWSHVFLSSDVFHIKSLALFFAERFKGKLTLEHWKILKTWVRGVENWAHSDSLCSLLSELFEKYPAQLLPTYKKWNKSKNPWERRISIVGLYYYARCRKIRQPSFELAHNFLKPLFSDSDFYVQKAVGWTLREMYQAHPQKTLKLIFSRAATLHPLAIQASTEKFNVKTKARFMKLRRDKE